MSWDPRSEKLKSKKNRWKEFSPCMPFLSLHMKNISKLGGSSESAEEPLTGAVQAHTNSTVIPLWVLLPQVQRLIIITPNVRTLEKMNSGLYESPPCNAMLSQFTSYPIMPSAYLQTRVNLFLISNIWSYIWIIIDIKWLLIIQGFQLIGARRSCLWRWRSEPALPKGNDYDTGVEDRILRNIFNKILQIYVHAGSCNVLCIERACGEYAAFSF